MRVCAYVCVRVCVWHILTSCIKELNQIKTSACAHKLTHNIVCAVKSRAPQRQNRNPSKAYHFVVGLNHPNCPPPLDILVVQAYKHDSITDNLMVYTCERERERVRRFELYGDTIEFVDMPT